MRDVAREFLYLLVTVLPYFVAGLALAVGLRRLLPATLWLKRWASGARGVYAATLAGALLPGCCMAAVPMAAALQVAGASRGVVAAFLLTSPLLSPQAFLLTWGVLGWRMALARLVSTFALLPVMGLGIEACDRGRGSRPPARGESLALLTPAGSSFWREVADLAFDYGRWLLLGLLIAAVLTGLAPPDLIARSVGATGPLAYLLAAAVGIPAYICEGEEVPLAYGMLRLGLGEGPTLTFLLGAVGTCLPTLVVSARLIGRRTTLAVAACWFAFSILAGVAYQSLAA